MKFQACADVHGAFERLNDLVDPSLPLIVLGDNLNLIDFNTLEGLVTKVVPREDIQRVLRAFAEEGPKKALAIADEVFFSNPERQRIAYEVCAKEYATIKDYLPKHTKVMYGNVDYPDLLFDSLPQEFVFETGNHTWFGHEFAVVNGTPPYPASMGLPGELSEEEFDRQVDDLHVAEMLLSHFPPNIPGMAYDTIVKREEGASDSLLNYCEKYEPALHLFGHIHNPKVREASRFHTSFVNIGGFRYNSNIHIFDTDEFV